MGRVIAAAAYSAGRRVADIAVEESGAWAAQPGHFVWIGIEAPSEPDLRQLQAQFGLARARPRGLMLTHIFLHRLRSSSCS